MTDTGDDSPEQQEQRLAEANVEELVREVLHRMHGALDQQARLRLLLDASVAMAGELTLDGVLSRIVAIATRLVDADFAALGVLSADAETTSDRRLRTFIHHGMDPDTVASIGPLPAGHGLLGLIIDRPEPVRLHDIAEHPASYGFPDRHPPMHSFLGVPIRVRGKVFGNLYLTEKADGADFTAEDEEIVVALAAAAGVAIENARLYEEASRREAWLRATAEIAAVLSGSTPRSEALQLVADRACETARADVVWIVAGTAAAELTFQAVSGEGTSLSDVDDISLEHSIARLVVEQGEPLVVDLSTDPRALSVDRVAGWDRLGPTIMVPFGPAWGAAGALALSWRPDHDEAFRAVDPAMPASFAEQAALALRVARAREDEQRLAVFEDRDRIGRDLHDLVIQRLFAVGLSLQGVVRRTDQPQLAERLNQAVDDLDATIRDIRRTIFALGTLESFDDIQAEVTRVVERASVTLGFRPELRFDGPVRTLVTDDLAPDLLAVLGEALSNVGRHARATAATVTLAVGGEVVLTVSDDGRGIPAGTTESGLANIRSRAARHGGSCTIDTAPGTGTVLRWAVPVR